MYNYEAQNEDLCGGYLPDVTEAFSFTHGLLSALDPLVVSEIQMWDEYIYFANALTVLVRVLDHSSLRYYTALTHMEGPNP